jgi:hypothetical protein
MLRFLLLVAVSELLVACDAPQPIHSRPAATLNDPAVYGRSDLLPEPELHALLAVARARLASLDPWRPICRVYVINHTKVEVYCGEATRDYDFTCLVVERSNGLWRITAVRPKVILPLPPNIIVTG